MRSVRAAIAAIGLGLALIASAGAQTYPDKPIRLICRSRPAARRISWRG